MDPSPTPPRIQCAGILVADIFVPPLPALPDAGQLVATGDFLVDSGGCAANVATGLARLGAPTAVAGKIGADLFGDFIVRDLAGKGIDTTRIVRTQTSGTSKTVILPVVGQDRRFIHTFGANADLRVDELTVEDGARILYLGGYLILPGIDRDALAALFANARARGVCTVLDVVVPRDAPDPMAALAPVLPHTDYFLPNDEEAHALTGEDDPLRQAARFLDAGCGTAIVTRGERGTVWSDAKQTLEAPVFPIEYVDGSGSGDAFAAGVLLGIAEGWSARETLRFASAIGASACTRLGCTTGVFTRAQADDFLAAHPLEIRERTAC